MFILAAPPSGKVETGRHSKGSKEPASLKITPAHGDEEKNQDKDFDSCFRTQHLSFQGNGFSEGTVLGSPAKQLDGAVTG